MSYTDEYSVLDLETTIRSPIGMPAHPMWPDNQIVYIGKKDVGHITGSVVTSSPLVECDGSVNESIEAIWKMSLHKDVMKVIVGHNLKFDLLYLLRKGYITPKWLVTKKVWDTQIAEYLLSAQTNLYPSLDECAVKYGGVLKDTVMKEFWRAGTPTETIPHSVISDYLKGDLENTEKVFLGQHKKAAEWGMLPLIESQMKAMIGVTLMEYNGMKIDRDYIERMSADLEKHLAHDVKVLYTSISTPVDYGEWNWNSTKDVSLYLFGGEYKVKEKVYVGKYKNGKDKYKMEERVRRFPAKITPPPESFGSVKTKLGYWTVDDKVLKNVGTTTALRILTLRELSKQRETYFENLKTLLFPNDFIHPNINQTQTKTGRLSCNKPNVQNQTEAGGIKEAYISRYGDDGVLVEFDYQQLEMAGLAIVSGDKQLISDINGGVDMHSALYEDMFGRKPTPEERKPFKRLSFGLVYGAGKQVLADNAGCSIEVAAKFIETFYSRYKGVKDYHDNIQVVAKKGRKVTSSHTPSGFPVGAYLHRLPTGRMFVFKEYDNKWKGGVSFSPTELKNWPVQGFSTGDVVPHMVGEVVAVVVKMGLRALPVMTVHDSLLFDVHKEQLASFTHLVEDVLKNTTKFMEKHFGIDIPVKIDVGCSVGVNWGKMEKV